MLGMEVDPQIAAYPSPHSISSYPSPPPSHQFLTPPLPTKLAIRLPPIRSLLGVACYLPPLERPQTSPRGSPTLNQRRVHKLSSVRACGPCKQQHTSCDHQRPCRRCVHKGRQSYCVDVPSRRGHKARLRNEELHVHRRLDRSHTLSPHQLHPEDDSTPYYSSDTFTSPSPNASPHPTFRKPAGMFIPPLVAPTSPRTVRRKPAAMPAPPLVATPIHYPVEEFQFPLPKERALYGMNAQDWEPPQPTASINQLRPYEEWERLDRNQRQRQRF